MALTDLLASAAHTIVRGALWAALGGYHEDTLTGGVTLGSTYPTLTGFDPGGAGRTIVLDGSTAAVGDGAISGMIRVILNRADAAENLTVNDALANTIATLNQNDAGIFYHDPDTGWTLVAVLTIALT